jgi:superfamily II DNA or RNA helicase
MKTLRPYQNAAAESVNRKYWATINRPLVQLPTGMGKTPLLARIPDTLGFSKRFLYVAHREELINQLADKLRTWTNSTVGVEMADREASSSDRFVVASVQTLNAQGGARLKRFNPADFDGVATDEAHHAVAQSYQNIYRHFNVWEDTSKLSVGVTATVNRADGKGLNEVFQEIAYSYSILDGIRDGWLSDLKGIQVRTATNLDNVKIRGGDFNEQELADTVNTAARNDAVVKAWLEHGEGRQTVVFCVDIAHAKAVADRFNKAGVAAEAIWGNDPDRKQKLAAHRKGEFKVLTNCQILTEGYDDWRIGCIVLARPTQSEGLYTQIVGRGTRIPEDVSNLVVAKEIGQYIAKQDCIILDVVDTTQRHSLVTLPSLFGMSDKLNLQGRTITDVMDEVDLLKADKPYLDLTQVENVHELQTYAQQVDLFKVGFDPEIVQFSQYQWHKTGLRQYTLFLVAGDQVSVAADLLDNWHLIGEVRGVQIADYKGSLKDAIEEADFQVKLNGGKTNQSFAKRLLVKDSGPPTASQIMLCRKIGLDIPRGATHGEVRLKLTKVLGERHQKRMQERRLG